VRFDDRLATVLAQPVESARDRAIRWRQLVDLVARSGGDGDPLVVGKAIDAIREDGPEVGEQVRAATARAIAGRPVPLGLLEVFAEDRLAIAAPLLAAAQLDPQSVEALRSVASDEVKPFLESLAPPTRDPTPVAARAQPETPAAVAPEPAKAEPVPSISDVVARIERLRSSRERSERPPAISHPPLSSPSLFRWECGPSGEIDWVEGAPRGAMVGRSIAAADIEEGVDDCVERAFEVRAPFRDCVLELGDEGPLAGQWIISGVPAFSPSDGRFIGYRGVARRDELEDEGPVEAAAKAATAGPVDHDSLREMIHEIKTPLNAIIGFAEIIDGQYFGPAHSRYRERAAEIVANARSLLEAAEDLDFAARLQSARARPGEGTEMSAFLPSFTETLQGRAARHGVAIDMNAALGVGRSALDPELMERLLRRFTDAVLSATASGEQLRLNVRRSGKALAFDITRPGATMMAGKEELLDPEFTIGDADRALLGLGFSLRLVNGLVGIAGGTLEIGEDQFTLSVPLAKA